MSWTDFHFIRPWVLLLLCLLPLFAWLIQQARATTQEWNKVCDPELLPYVVESQPSPKARFRWVWVMIIGSIALFALAGPAWQRIPQPVFEDKQALVILLDSSRSMDAEDIKPSRYERAKLKVLDLLNERTTGQTALIAYAAEPYVVSPLTTDGNTIASLVPSLKTYFMPRQGSNIGLATEKAVELLNNAGARGQVLLITDGIKNKNLDKAIKTANQNQVRISVIGVGTRSGAPIPSKQGYFKDANGNIVIAKRDTSNLQQLAQQTGGTYSNLTANDSDLARTAIERPLSNADKPESTEFNADQWEEHGPWLLLPLLLILPLFFRRGVLSIGIALPLAFTLVNSPTAEADEWDWRDLFRNQEQRASAQFDEEAFESSAQQFKSPEWKASAQFRAGDYASAAETLETIDTPEANYNRGNALAKLGDIDAAIAAYEKTLKADKQHADAKHNLELLKKQKEQSSNSEKKSESGENANQDQSNQQDSGQQNSEQQSSQEQPSNQQSSQESEQSDSSSNQSNEDKASSSDTSESAQESDSSSSEDESENTEQKARSEKQSNEKNNNASYQQQYKNKTEQEIEQATQQWLRRIPDQPGNLLRNQFENEHRRRQKQGGSNTEDQPW